jgi:thioredoxin-related protein
VPHLQQILRACVALALASVLLASHATALEFVMFRRAGCPWCAAWDREIGPVYPKTDIGRRIPIRFIDIHEAAAKKIMLKAPVRYTPTFVLVDGEQEIGRIEGYPGEDFFWPRVEALIASAPAKTGDESVASGPAGTP